MIDKMYKLFLDELGVVNDSSYFAHQAMCNPKECGVLVEAAVRKFISEVIGDRFKVTHGYIYSTEAKDLSPQLDVIITDSLVPHRLKKFEYLDGLQIVPAEAVVGIFEVKRSLSKESIKEAAAHLKKIIDFIPLKKDNPLNFLPGGVEIGAGLQGKIFSNPLIGIIGLNHSITNADLPELNPYPFLDIIYSLDGLCISTSDSIESNKLTPILCRDKSIPIIYKIVKSDEQIIFDKEQILKIFVACLINYLSRTSGRIMNMSDYFNIDIKLKGKE